MTFIFEPNEISSTFLVLLGSLNILDLSKFTLWVGFK